MTTELKRGWKKSKAIEIIESNLDKDFFEVANMIAEALDLSKYAGRAYYKYMIKHGLISRFSPTDTPWKSAKRAQKASKSSAPKSEKAVSVKTVAKAKSAAAPTNSAGDFLNALAAEAMRSKSAKVTKAA